MGRWLDAKFARTDVWGNLIKAHPFDFSNRIYPRDEIDM